MTLLLPEELEALSSRMRRQAARTIEPLVEPLDRDQAFSVEVQEALRAMDVFALPFAEDRPVPLR